MRVVSAGIRQGKGYGVVTLRNLMGGDAALAGRTGSMETVLRVLRRVTGLRIVLVARLTESSWTACSVLDDAGYGIAPGDELALSDTY